MIITRIKKIIQQNIVKGLKKIYYEAIIMFFTIHLKLEFLQIQLCINKKKHFQ
jgi:hypothetical protein